MDGCAACWLLRCARAARPLALREWREVGGTGDSWGGTRGTGYPFYLPSTSPQLLVVAGADDDGTGCSAVDGREQ